MIKRIGLSLLIGAGISLLSGYVGNNFVNYSIEFAFRVCLGFCAGDVFYYLFKAINSKADPIGEFYSPLYMAEAKNNFMYFGITLIIWLSSKAILGSV